VKLVREKVTPLNFFILQCNTSFVLASSTFERSKLSTIKFWKYQNFAFNYAKIRLVLYAMLNQNWSYTLSKNLRQFLYSFKQSFFQITQFLSLFTFLSLSFLLIITSFLYLCLSWCKEGLISNEAISKTTISNSQWNSIPYNHAPYPPGPPPTLLISIFEVRDPRKRDQWLITRALRYKLFFVKALTKRLRKLTILTKRL